MNCIVPIVPGSAGSATAVSGGAGTSWLAATGAGDATLLIAAAVFLVSTGILVVLVTRRRRRLANNALGSATRRIPAGGALLALGVLLTLGMVTSPAPAHAVTPLTVNSASACNAIEVSNVSVDGVSTAGGALLVLPGSEPVSVRATVRNVGNTAVSLFIRASASADTPLAREVQWTAVNGSDTASGVLTDATGQPIGSLSPGATADISLTMAIPASLGNEFQGQSVDVSVFLTATP